MTLGQRLPKVIKTGILSLIRLQSRLLLLRPLQPGELLRRLQFGTGTVFLIHFIFRMLMELTFETWKDSSLVQMNRSVFALYTMPRAMSEQLAPQVLRDQRAQRDQLVLTVSASMEWTAILAPPARVVLPVPQDQRDQPGPQVRPEPAVPPDLLAIADRQDRQAQAGTQG
jgi:hypothetical protein